MGNPKSAAFLAGLNRERTARIQAARDAARADGRPVVETGGAAYQRERAEAKRVYRKRRASLKPRVELTVEQEARLVTDIVHAVLQSLEARDRMAYGPALGSWNSDVLIKDKEPDDG